MCSATNQQMDWHRIERTTNVRWHDRSDRVCRTRRRKDWPKIVGGPDVMVGNAMYKIQLHSSDDATWVLQTHFLSNLGVSPTKDSLGSDHLSLQFGVTSYPCRHVDKCQMPWIVEGFQIQHWVHKFVLTLAQSHYQRMSICRWKCSGKRVIGWNHEKVSVTLFGGMDTPFAGIIQHIQGFGRWSNCNV